MSFSLLLTTVLIYELGLSVVVSVKVDPLSLVYLFYAIPGVTMERYTYLHDKCRTVKVRATEP